MTTEGKSWHFFISHKQGMQLRTPGVSDPAWTLWISNLSPLGNAKDLAMMLHLSLQLFGYQSWLDQDEDPTQVRVRSV
jgi:hypothetical protein